MNYKAALKYQFAEFKKSVIIFYAIVIAVIALFMLLIATDNSSNFNSTGGIEMSSFIFLFVCGLNCFKETFLMMLQNGISRKTMFISRIVSMVGISVLMAIIDRIMVMLFGRFNGTNVRFNIVGLYEQYFSNHANNIGLLQKYAEGTLTTILLYLAAIAFGYFITSAYYRMNKALKAGVSIGVPVGLFIVLPLVDSALTNGKIMEVFSRFIEFAFGIKNGLPYNLMITSGLSFIIFFVLSWLLIRKATDKN